ncbi:Uncharacterised protein [Clostridioides difficile]|nr:Uncharacterised protein [Clostridioides difficile]
MKACNLPFDINIPFTKPTAIPTNAATITARNTFPVDLIIDAAKAPLIARVEPTDKSIPPVKITKVISQQLIS